MGAEGYGDGVGGFDDGGGEDEEVGYVGEDVAQDDKGEGGVDDAGKIACGVLELGGHVVDLVLLVTFIGVVGCGGHTLSQPSKAQSPA